ncbi:hypothetical protein SAMN05192568_106914 [Methylobacterium pseudosasicola]|uniref:Uncharacterized protein n=1 Tax=Methylobacterium pseudosasicola TaxID=582667 RepID=A0A1I4UFD9_9HYPH|nr:hypothetical protein SAMN05192568_106914 [Methylobacterium pseudosasicola]
MLNRGSAIVGDLEPIGVARHLRVVRRGDPLSAYATISISCLSTLALLATGAAWLAPPNGWMPPTSTHHTPPAMPVEAPVIFPSWVEVPHLTGPLSTREDPDASPPADGPRTFLDPGPADMGEQPVFLPPRANPRLPLIGRAPLDAAHLTYERSPVWNEPTDRRDVGTSVPPSVVATLELDVPRQSEDRAEPGLTHTLPTGPTPAPILSPRAMQTQAPTEVLVNPAPTITTSRPPERVAGLNPDPKQQVADRTSPITPPDVRAVTLPILKPDPAGHARSLRQPRVVATASQVRVPYRDAEQTASIIGLPRSARVRVDAGKIAHASLHRARAERSAGPSPTSAPSAPWTLPPALAPTD